MKEWCNIHKTKLLAGAGILIIVVMYFFMNQTNKNEVVFGNISPPTMEQSQTDKMTEKVEPFIIMVDIKGAVKGPGVYQATEGERVIDLINKAGGFATGADQNQVNLSERVVDEMVIFVPTVGEDGENITLENGTGQSKFVNINKATESDLQTLPGIGPAKATAILEYRETNGGFQTIEDLKKVSGIGKKTFEKLAPFISVK